MWNRYIQIVNVISSLVYRNGNEWFTFYVTLTRTDHTSASITISDGMDTALLNPSAEPLQRTFFVTFYRKKIPLVSSSFRFYKKKMFWCPPQPTHSSLLIIVFIWHFIQFQLIYVLQWAPHRIDPCVTSLYNRSQQIKYGFTLFNEWFTSNTATSV